LLSGQEDREFVIVSGLSIYTWLTIFKGCHSMVEGSPIRTAYPNGQCYDEQPAILNTMFEFIEDGIRKELQEQINRGKRN